MRESTLRRPASAHSQKGVMLLEALIGILIFTVGILAMIAMQALAVSYTSDAKYRSDASFLANELIGQIWVDRANLANYATPGGTAPALATWIAKVQNDLPGSTGANAPSVAPDAATGKVEIIIYWLPPTADSRHNYHTIAYVTNP